MTARIGYVMGSPPGDHRAAELRAGIRPRVEYDEFLERHPGAEVIDPRRAADVAGPTGMLVRGRVHAATAAVALQAKPAYERFIATGEDIGLPLAFLAWMRRDRRPINIVTHGSYFASPKFAASARWLRRMRNVRFLTLSESLADVLTARFGLPAERVFNASYATDIRFFTPACGKVEPDLVVSVGTANRDYRLLVDVAQALGARLEIAADSAWFRTKTNIDGESLPEGVRTGSYSYPELRELYARAAVVVVPLHGGLHACGYSAIAEAMGMGKPVIATKTACPSDFVVDGETGFYVDPGDGDGLTEKLGALLADPSRAEEMGRAGRQRIEAYSVERYAERLAEGAGISTVSDPRIAAVAGR